MSHATGWVIGVVVVAAGAGTSVWWVNRPTSADLAEGPPPRTAFAEDTLPLAAPVKFEPERAMKYLKQLCDIGPRVSGSEGMKKQQALIEKHFQALGATVTRQEFTARQRSQAQPTPMTNLIITWYPDKGRRVIFCSHYDTRPIADQERDPNQWTRPFLSANDGTSGVAWMMELGHHMKDLKPEVGVDFVLFDGEEYVFRTQATGGDDKYFFGSEYFADDYAKKRDTRKYRYDAAILLDLFAGKGASLKAEIHSGQLARPLLDQVWTVAGRVQARSFKNEFGYEVQDDHLALNLAGIPAIDVIDFDYPHWHKLSDTPDKVSGEQLAEVATVLTAWVMQVK